LRNLSTLSLAKAVPLVEVLRGFLVMRYLLFLVLIFSCPLIAKGASELTIQDTSGFTRASSEIEETGQIEFSLIDAAGSPAEGVEVTLTNTATGETLTAASINGNVTFDGISPGVWTVSTTAQGVTFTNVTVLNAMAVGGLAGSGIGTGAVLLGSTGAAVGGAAIVHNISDGDSSDDAPLSPAS
jgi:hypothetical protein